MLWLKQSLTLKVVPEMIYELTVKAGSSSDVFLIKNVKSGIFFSEVI